MTGDGAAGEHQLMREIRPAGWDGTDADPPDLHVTVSSRQRLRSRAERGARRPRTRGTAR